MSSPHSFVTEEGAFLRGQMRMEDHVELDLGPNLKIPPLRAACRMKYAELALQTHRQPRPMPAAPGQAFLIRAGYLSHSGEWLPLGQAALQTIREQRARTPAFISQLGLHSFGEKEIFYPLETGDTEMLHCPACGFAARLELAPVKKTVFAPEEPPAPLQKVLTPNCPTIESLAAFLGIPQEKTAKALMFVRRSDGQFVFVVIRGDHALQPGQTDRPGGAKPAWQPKTKSAQWARHGLRLPIRIRSALIVVDDPDSPLPQPGCRSQRGRLSPAQHQLRTRLHRRPGGRT